MVETVYYEGNELLLAEEVPLGYLMICIASETPPVDLRCRKSISEVQEKALYDEKKLDIAKADILCKLIRGDISSFGKKGTYSQNYEMYRCYPDEHEDILLSSQEKLLIDPSLWLTNLVRWDPDCLSVEAVEENPMEEDFDAEYKERRLDCFCEVRVPISDVKRAWPSFFVDEKKRDWEQEYKEMVEKYDLLCTQNEELKRKIPEKKENVTGEKRELISLQKMLFGIVCVRYSYCPEDLKSRSIKKIHDDLLLQGISLDEDTIRRHVKKANLVVQELVDNFKPNKPSYKTE